MDKKIDACIEKLDIMATMIADNDKLLKEGYHKTMLTIYLANLAVAIGMVFTIFFFTRIH